MFNRKKDDDDFPGLPNMASQFQTPVAAMSPVQGWYAKYQDGPNKVLFSRVIVFTYDPEDDEPVGWDAPEGKMNRCSDSDHFQGYVYSAYAKISRYNSNQWRALHEPRTPK